jgi:hypothetical protein
MDIGIPQIKEILWEATVKLPRPVPTKMAPYTPGCVFEYLGRIPETAFSPKSFNSPLEQAVYTNDLQKFNDLVKEGEAVSVRLKIGEMSCLEFAAMKGYTDILAELLSRSVCAEMLQRYFQLDDVVDRAYLISKNKETFFGPQAALAEANRYVAALYTAVVYNQPACVELMLNHVGRGDPARHNFITTHDCHTQTLNAGDLAHSLGHMECYKIITQRQQASEVC